MKLAAELTTEDDSPENLFVGREAETRGARRSATRVLRAQICR